MNQSAINEVSLSRPGWLLLAAFAGVQLIIILFAANGPFLDEAIYATTGRRVLEGYAFSRESADWYYREWFLGSPFVWPVLSSSAYSLGGLAAARLLALLCAVAALLLLFRAGARLLGHRAALWAVFALAFNGLFAAHSHLAVYDALALALTALALLAAVRYLDDRRRQWLLLASLAVALATITKYGYALAAVPVLGIAVSRSSLNQALKQAATFLGPAAAILVIYHYATFGAPYPAALLEYSAHDRPFGRAALLQRHLLWLVLPAAFAVYGAVLLWRRREKWLAGVLLGSLFLAPAYHIWSRQYVSAYKHVVIGLLFAAPLVGLALDILWRRWQRTLRYLLPLAVLLEGAAQWYVQEHSWPDARAAAAYVLDNYGSGQVFVSEQAWIYRMYLYWAGKIEDPLMLWDGWYVEARSPDLCESEWLVGEYGGAYPQGDRMVRAARTCGHELSFEDRSLTIIPRSSGALHITEVAVQVYRQRAGSARDDSAIE